MIGPGPHLSQRPLVEPGTRLGGLEVVGQLGAGGQGEVYLARPWDERPAHRAAARLWLRSCARSDALSAGLARRWHLGALKLARAAMDDSLLDEHGHLAAPAARHQHLACLYSGRFPGAGAQSDLGFARVGGRQAPRLYLGLAFEAGAPLRLLLRRWRGRRPTPRWSLAVARQVAQALAHLHKRGVVHHDVRPANVIIRPGPHAVLIDLGAAETPGAPRRRAVYGATGWLPPERRGASPAPASPLVDIYGVGMLLHTLTARLALPAPLSGLLADALAPDPERRWGAIPSMDALVERLGDLLAAHGG